MFVEIIILFILSNKTMSTEMERVMELGRKLHGYTDPEQVKAHYKEYAHEYDKVYFLFLLEFLKF